MAGYRSAANGFVRGVSEKRTRAAATARSGVQLPDGMAVAAQGAGMIHFFKAGPELVRWEITQITPDGTCCLSVQHAHGRIVEYFRSGAMAVRRVQELEELLVRARGFVDEASKQAAS
jgi:hypothetical protein